MRSAAVLPVPSLSFDPISPTPEKGFVKEHVEIELERNAIGLRLPRRAGFYRSSTKLLKTLISDDEWYDSLPAIDVKDLTQIDFHILPAAPIIKAQVGSIRGVVIQARDEKRVYHAQVFFPSRRNPYSSACLIGEGAPPPLFVIEATGFAHQVNHNLHILAVSRLCQNGEAEFGFIDEDTRQVTYKNFTLMKEGELTPADILTGHVSR